MAANGSNVSSGPSLQEESLYNETLAFERMLGIAIPAIYGVFILVGLAGKETSLCFGPFDQGKADLTSPSVSR